MRMRSQMVIHGDALPGFFRSFWELQHDRFLGLPYSFLLDVVNVQFDDVLLFISFLYLSCLRCNLDIISRWFQCERSTGSTQQLTVADLPWRAEKQQLARLYRPLFFNYQTIHEEE